MFPPTPGRNKCSKYFHHKYDMGVKWERKLPNCFPASRAVPNRLLLSSNEESWISQKNSLFKCQASYKQASELHVPVAY